MQISERLWAVITTLANILTFSSPQDGTIEPSPLQISLQVPASLPAIPHMNDVPGPVFQPPGSPASSSFVCNYTSMVGWEACSSRTNRQCWLRRASDGAQYDVFTDYEFDMPTGITRYYELDLTDGSWDADGISFPYAKLFGDTYPGPWIEACWGDRIIINVTNSLAAQGTSVHWHGIRQNLTMHMDGVNGITQCPIAPGDYFVYNFTAGQYGSSWYHSHYSVQYADGAAGPMTLHGPSSDGFDEAISPPLILSDWGHNSAFDAIKTGTLDNFDILLNGLGDVKKFNNSAVYNTTVKPLYSMTFDGPQESLPNKKYLMRIINTSFTTTFIFSIDNHILRVVSNDFVPIVPYETTSILVSIGQRYNVIVEALPQIDPSNPVPLPTDKNFWIRTIIAECLSDSAPGDKGYETTGILRYNQSSTAYPTSAQWSNIPDDCVDESYTSLHPTVPWFVGDSSNNPPGGQDFGVRDGRLTYPLGFFALGSATDPSIQVNYQNITFFNLENNGSWNPVWRVEPEDYTAANWVYLVIQNDNVTGAHPIHLHGHDFAILEQVYNQTYNASTANLNFLNPPRRDVVLLPAKGYVVIAFKADNPGTWLVHCHIAFHISAGLGMQILEDQEAAAKIWPTGNSSALTAAHRVCDNWGAWCTKQNSSNPLCQPVDSGV